MAMAAVHSFLFPKKKGKALEKVKPLIVEVYEGSYDVKPPSGIRSQRLGQFLHIHYHSIPRDDRFRFRCALLAAFAAGWMALFPKALKFRVALIATAYSFTEATFTIGERGRSYTTLAQLGANLLYLPALLDGYGSLVGRRPVPYVLLFPLNVWLLEAVEHFCIIKPIFGRNVAWLYLDYADEFWQGAARLGHGLFWLAAGALLYPTYPVLQDLSRRVCG